MPLARIDLLEGKSAQYRRTIADVVYEQMIACLGVPEDRFQLIFLDVASADQKAAFYKAVVDDLHAKLHVRPEDVFFNLMTVDSADFSMGMGRATYVNGVPTDRLDPDSIPG